MYNWLVYNWSVDVSRLKRNPDKYERFVLEQRINFGLGGGRLSKESLKRHWSKLVIDSKKREYLEKLLWPKF